MHIPDNYLSPASCAVLAVAAACYCLVCQKSQGPIKRKQRASSDAWDRCFFVLLIDDV